MSSATATIPRFLLPQTGSIWRRQIFVRVPTTWTSQLTPLTPVIIRLSSSNSKPATNAQGQRLLAKPERFTPPSHPSALPRKNAPRVYGGDLSAEEKKAQEEKHYPGLPPPPGSKAYKFIHSRWIHVSITLGTLTVLTIWTLVLDFQKNSPFADMLPSTSDFLARPLTSLYMVVEVLRLHEAHKSAQIAEKRKRYVEDVAKRRAYRKAHGLPEEVGLFNQPMARIKTDEEIEEEKRKAAEEKEQQRLQEEEETKRRKDPEVRPLTEEERQEVVKQIKGKWLGIF